jgi:2-methylisocitrate lyase-like PEP mutase family enzyme
LVRRGTPPLRTLRDLGVRRVGVGPGLQRVALDAVQRFAKRLDIGSDRVLFE